MSRIYLSLVLVIHSVGCSEQTTPPPAPLPETGQAGKSAMTLYRETQALMEEGKLEEGYESAKRAMRQFIAQDDDLFWMLLESIEAGDKRINVHFNMGKHERKMPDDGIVRPLSFQIWSGGDDSDRMRPVAIFWSPVTSELLHTISWRSWRTPVRSSSSR